MRLGCPSGKKSYPNEEIANNALVLIRARYRQKGNVRMPKKSYFCSRCEEWHLTSGKERRQPGSGRGGRSGTKKAPQSQAD